jgi:cytochrome bd-type quinol oxidase subunit 2
VTQYATDLSRTRSRRSARVISLLAIGPIVVVAGIVWAFVQPWRVTLLHPHGEEFWWLVVEPPLLVVAVGLVFHALVARPLVDDLEEDAG